MNRFFTFLLIYSIGAGANAQDVHFSQFYENAALRNPALTGIFSGDYKAGVNYRNQWSSISVPFRTMLASAEARINVNEVGDHVSFGLTATYDKAGSINFNSLQLYPTINYNKSLDDKRRSYLSVGFTAGYAQRSVDPSKMTFASQSVNGVINPANPSGEQFTQTKYGYFDAGAGISFNSSLGRRNNINYYLGAAAYHINRPKASFNQSESSRMDMKWNGNVGFECLVNEQIGITMHVNYSKQGDFQEVIAGFLASWRNYDDATQPQLILYAGLFYRLNDAYIPTLKLDYKSYSVTVSYDFNISSLKPASNQMGGMEISLFTRGYLSKGWWAKDKFKSPRFEQ